MIVVGRRRRGTHANRARLVVWLFGNTAGYAEDNDALPISGPPEQVTEMMAASSARLKKLVADIGLQPE